MGWQITRNSKYLKVTPITWEQYLRDQLSDERKTDTLDDIIWQFENYMQQDKDWTYNEARNERATNGIKDSTHQNKRPDTTNDCTVNPHKTIAVTSNGENSASIESPKKCWQLAKCKTDEHCDRNTKTQYGKIMTNQTNILNIRKYQ